MEQLQSSDATEVSWMKRFNSQSRTLVEHALLASKESNSPEIYYGAVQMVDLLKGNKRYQTDCVEEKLNIRYPVQIRKGDEKPYWESRITEARKDLNEFYDYMESSGNIRKIYPPTRRLLEDDFVDIFHLAKDKVIRERQRTTRGMFQVYREEISSNYSQSKVKDNLTELANLFQGKSYDAVTGKRIWKWKDRLNYAEKVLKNIEEEAKEEFKEGKIDGKKGKSIFLSARRAFEIGITSNTYLQNKYGSDKSQVNIYDPLEKMKSPWEFDSPISEIDNEEFISKPLDQNKVDIPNNETLNEPILSFIQKVANPLKKFAIGAAGLIGFLRPNLK